MSIKSRLKELMHRHKFETLLLYPPRPNYVDAYWGSLLLCDCGCTKLTRLPCFIKNVLEIGSILKEEKSCHYNTQSKNKAV